MKIKILLFMAVFFLIAITSTNKANASNVDSANHFANDGFNQLLVAAASVEPAPEFTNGDVSDVIQLATATTVDVPQFVDGDVIQSYKPESPVASSGQVQTNLRSQGNGCGRQKHWYVPNGDPISQILTLTALDNFANACNKHDRCYNTVGASKKKCDDLFEMNLKKACEDTYSLYISRIKYIGFLIKHVMTKPNPAYWGCIADAELYAAVVRNSDEAQEAFYAERRFRVHFKNSCHKTIYAAIHYRDLDGDWVTEGWWKLSPGEKNYVADTDNTIYYSYAYSKGPNRSYWAGDDGYRWSVRNSEKTYEFREKKITSKYWEDRTENFTCN